MGPAHADRERRRHSGPVEHLVQPKSKALSEFYDRVIKPLDKQPNGGKAEAVRYGMLHAIALGDADYTGFWKWQIKQHLRPVVFDKLSDQKLQKYADAFNIKVEDLKSMTVHED